MGWNDLGMRRGIRLLSRALGHTIFFAHRREHTQARPGVLRPRKRGFWFKGVQEPCSRRCGCAGLVNARRAAFVATPHGI